MAQTALDSAVDRILADIERLGSAVRREEMATRYGIITQKAHGVAIGDLQKLARQIGHDHDLALRLWKSGWYEARILACFIGDADKISSQQMDEWRQTFDNWGIVDTACLHLFDKSPLAWHKVAEWCPLDDEFGRRAGFALLAALALHDRKAPDERFEASLELIRAYATDNRNFVKKSVSWALHAIGIRNRALHTRSLALAQELATSMDRAERWVGKDAMKKLQTPASLRRLKT
jgi:3-methyladenine DNA glycosylase AlkD